MLAKPGSSNHLDPLIPTIFHEPWWLNAATGGDYHEVTVRNGTRTVGRFPYVSDRLAFGRVASTTPRLVHFLGPAIDDGTGSAANRALRRNTILRDLLSDMPVTGGFHHKMHRGVSEAILFQEEGFQVSVQFTFEIAPAPASLIWSRMRDKTRNVIRQAGKCLAVSECSDVEAFIDFYNGNLCEGGALNYYGRPTMQRICAEAIGRGRGAILAARGEDGALAAAILYIWDAQAAYYLLTTRAKDAGNGATSLLLWHAIQDSAARGLVFDFDGFISRGNRLFFTGFGGEVRPRYVVSWLTLRHRLARSAAALYRRTSL